MFTLKILITKFNHKIFFSSLFSCKSPNELAPGCTAVSTTDSNNLHMTLDPERDLQRIHSLIIAHFGCIETLIQACENEYCRAVPRMMPFVIEDSRGLYNLLVQLREIAYQIEQKHRVYQRTLARDTKYGSK